TTVSCGRAASRLLRQGQAPVFDYPLFVSEGAPGRIWKYERDRSRTVLIEGLSDPRGLATDRANALYVVEQGAGRLLKVNTQTGASSIVLSGLSTPSVVAVDSFGTPYVTQDGTRDVVQAPHGSVVADFSTRPSAI